jgi:uncharacterized protein YegL
MNQNLTEIAFVLDRSGSMEAVAHAAVVGFNTFLAGQQAAAGLARLTLVLFDDEYLVPFVSLPVGEVVPLNSDTYVPRGGTALLDAIGLTIDGLGKRLDQSSESDRAGKVMVAILTDGLENSSCKYSWAQISRRIRHQTSVYKWEFLFLGANQDAIATAAKLNIAAHNASGFAADAAGVVASAGAVSRKFSAIRAAAAGIPLGGKMASDLSAPLDSLVAEEYEKE